MDALEALAMLEETSADTRIMALQDAWAVALSTAAAGTLEADEQRALALAHAVDEGLNHREISVAIKVSQSYVVYLLRYHRFLITRVIKIQEGTFRKYWEEQSDPREQTRDPIKRAAYEESVFQQIAKQIDAGIPPQKHPRTIKPVTKADIRKKSDPLAAYRKEVEKRIKEEIYPLVNDMKQLFGCDRSSYAPNLIGAMGMKLEKIMERIVDLLAPVND